MYPHRIGCKQKIDKLSECQGNSKIEQVWSGNNWVNRGARTFMFSILPWHLEQTFAAAAKTFNIHVC